VIRHRFGEPVWSAVYPPARSGAVAGVMFNTGFRRRADLCVMDGVSLSSAMNAKRTGAARVDLPDSLPPERAAGPPEAKESSGMHRE
jgi:hypothetical protein